MRRRAAVVLGALLLTAVAACGPGADPSPGESVSEAPSPLASSSALPLSILYLGDSMTLGVNACGEAGRCADGSWSEGVEKVSSTSAQLAALTGSAPTVTNLAHEGYKIGDVANQLDAVVAAAPDVVLLLAGANDACTTHLGSVTPVEDWAATLEGLLTGIDERLPETETIVLSVPDLTRLRELGAAEPDAVAIWSQFDDCNSLLAEPTSTAAADVERRDAVGAAVTGYNAAIEEVCGALERCRTDGGAFHATDLTLEDVSPIDYFHLSAAGQQRLADLAFDALVGRS